MWSIRFSRTFSFNNPRAQQIAICSAQALPYFLLMRSLPIIFPDVFFALECSYTFPLYKCTHLMEKVQSITKMLQTKRFPWHFGSVERINQYKWLQMLMMLNLQLEAHSESFLKIHSLLNVEYSVTLSP